MMVHGRTAVLLIATLALVVGCANESVVSSRSAEHRADAVLEALYDRDWQALSQLAHPDRGILFSAYSYVDRDTDVVLHPSVIENLAHHDSIYVWGAEDGTGEPIEASAREYVTERMLDRDFRDEKRGGRNEQIGSGNTINNLPDAFYDTREGGGDGGREIVYFEYHDAGTEAFGGMDWASLRIVLERTDGQWFVIGLVRDQWTI